MYLYQYGGPLLMVVGSVGCILSLLIFSTKSLRKNPCSIYFIAYNIANLCQICTTFLQAILAYGYNIDISVSSISSCRFICYIGYVFDILSPFYLILASIDRMLVTSRNARTRKFSNNHLAYGSVISGTICWILFHIHIFIFFKIIEVIPNYYICYTNSNVYLAFANYYGLIKTIIIPILMLIFEVYTIKNIQSSHRTRAAPLTTTVGELQEANRSPIFGYEDSPILTLEEAVEKLIPLVPDVIAYVMTAKKKYIQHSDLLTSDESAAIYLYSMPSSFFSSLNNALRAENRHALKPWFAYLKLFMTALNKLPSTKTIVWRGVYADVSSVFANNNIDIWWSVNSTSMDLKIVEPFLGKHGTLFTIEAICGKDISQFSACPQEKEVILMPGTRVRARADPLNFDNRLFVVHLDEVTPQSESQFEPNHLFEWIKQEYWQNGYIQRLMNPAKFYPIEESYINLAIVETKQQQQKEKQLRDASNSDAIMRSFEEIYGTKTTIDVKNIFETCKNQEKKVLVFGRAGIGKSTFCRYIAYQWAMDLCWTEYELLALIPLRRLTTNRYPPLPAGQNYSLIDLVKKEIFSYNLSENEDKLLKKHFDAKKTLWILDGYDEIIQNVPSHLECLFEQLLKTSHHILTSRPYQNVLAYHVQMEITGFTDENIERYVKQFFDQMKDELDSSLNKSQKLFRFLKTNPSMWGVAHIPVNLELICSLWSNEDFIETKELTITSLYTVMIEWLCRRYLSMPNKKIQNLSKDDVNQRCDKELAFLENLAFNGMKNNTIILRSNLLRKALNEEKISLHNHPHVLNMGILKSFNKQGNDTQIETDKDHYFVHLSFQEYFAARYLIKALKESSTHEEEMKFIQREKYNRRYALVFAFLSGLSSEADSDMCLNIFWRLILTPPMDLVGIGHMQLVISCIEETSSQSTIPQHTLLIEWIAKCIENNLSTENKIIRQYLAQSLRRAPSVISSQRIINVITHLLQNDDLSIRIGMLSFISEMNSSKLAVPLINLVVIALGDKSEGIRYYACQALGNMDENAATSEVITKLVSALEDESYSVRVNACEALRDLGNKTATTEVITKLVSALDDKSEWIRAGACEALRDIGEKAATSEVITKLVSVLEDASENVRGDACRALGKMGEKAAMNEVITKLVNALEDKSEYTRSSACRALGKMGEKAATNEVITKLVSALEDESERVRFGVCEALGNIGKKAATTEVITKLISALENKNDYARSGACEALGNIGEKAATNEVITRLVCALEHKSHYTRSSACEALGKMGEKAATNEVITKLVSALEDKSHNVRSSACKAVVNIGEKAVTSEMITKLVSALEDESERVRSWACQALRSIGEKIATNEVITKLVSALEDDSEEVRRSAYQALGDIGEKAATNEVITKLVNRCDTDGLLSVQAAYCINGIFSSSTVMIRFGPVLLSKLCMCRRQLSCLKNISVDELIRNFFDTQDADWLLPVTEIALQKGAAVSISEDKLMVYDNGGPIELRVPNFKLRNELVEAFTTY
ncbi:unnamed protein product [Adineta steineri]|uniref:NAD(P)(+)--arginine ADP-ribosyltransferase n=1 Tax=Adineta steineri TaxID=433720 RepID=A0A815K0T4_9BILA|nr:unnamed protein product [Adineta steineri]CAF3816393.1 unnamed protein product [Adineta steineri]